MAEISNKDNSDDMPSIQSVTEWTVIVSRFESFKNFYIQKIEKKSNSPLTFISDRSKYLTLQPCVGSIVETLTDKRDNIYYKAEVMAIIHNLGIIVRVLNDGSICKAIHMKDLPVSYHCYIDDDSGYDDGLTNDPYNLSIITNIMMSREWTMTTASDREPYKVTLSINGEDCFSFIANLLAPPAVVENAGNNDFSASVDDVVAENMDALIITEEKSEHESANINDDATNDLIVPDTETVYVKSFVTFKNFFVKSDSLYTLYMERIDAELETCKPLKRKFKNKVGSIMVAIDKTLNRRFRVLVESISFHGNTNCYLLDYGEYDIYREFCEPTQFLRKCPPIVRRCSLYAPKLDGKNDEIWFADVDEMFKDILSIECVKFDMIIKVKETKKHPYVVKLMLDNIDIGDIICPINIRVTHVNSLTDFKIQGISDEPKSVTALLENVDVPEVVVKNPISGNLYLAKSKSKFTRVKFDYFCGTEYMVIDIDNTMDTFMVHTLYEIPESLSDFPVSTMACSLILDGTEEEYYLNAFKYLVDKKVVFVMSIIRENEGTKPNLVKLYCNKNNVFDVFKSMKFTGKNN